MDVVRQYRIAALVGAPALELAAQSASGLPDVLMTRVLALLLHLAAIGCVAYVGASWAAEHLLQARDAAAVSPLAERRRRGVEIGPDRVRTAIGDGAGTPREIAEVVGVFEHVARKMVLTLLEAGQVVEREGRYELLRPQATAGLRPAAAHWIDKDV